MSADIGLWLTVIQDVKSIVDEAQTIQLLKELDVKLTHIQQSLDETILRDMRTGMQHLMDGMQSDVPHIRQDDFREAHAKFNMLMSLDPNGTIQGTSGTIENTRLIMLGYWGNFYYFALRGDMKTALTRLYTCALKYPDSLELFPELYFTKKYRKIISESLATLQQLGEQVEKMKGHNALKKLGYYFRQGLRVSVIGGIVSTTAPFLIGLSGGFGTSVVAAMTHGLWQSTEVKVPQYDNFEDLEKAITKSQKKLEKALSDLQTECQYRLDMLQTHSIESLLQLPPEAIPKSSPKRTKKTL